MESSFLNLVRGNRLTSYMGLEMVPEYTYKFAPDYSYLEVPVLGFFLDADEKLVDKASRNQYVRVLPACTIDVKGSYKVQIEPNPELAKYGIFQPGYYVQPGSGNQRPGFYMQMRKDMDLTDVKYAVRIYMRA